MSLSFPTVRRARRPLLTAAAALAVTLPAAAFAQGIGFTMRTTQDGGSPSTMRVRARGDVMRFDGVAEGQQSKDEFGEGAYTLVDAANRRIQVVMPGIKQYWELKFDDSTAIAIKTAGAAAGAVADLKVSGQTLGANHYKLTTDFSEIRGDGQRPRKEHVVEEYWTSDQLRDVVDPLEQLGRTLGGKGGYVQSPFAAIGGSSINDLLSRRQAEQRRMFKGFPVKTVTTSEETESDGRVTKTVSTTEITDVQHGNFDAALFKVPEGYTAFDPRALMGNMNAQLKDAFRNMGRNKASTAAGSAAGAAGAAGATDSSSMGDAIKEGAKDVAKDAAKESAKDAVKGALGGFLKRKKP